MPACSAMMDCYPSGTASQGEAFLSLFMARCHSNRKVKKTPGQAEVELWWIYPCYMSWPLRMMSQVSNYNELDWPISPDVDIELGCWIYALSSLFLPVAEDGRDTGAACSGEIQGSTVYIYLKTDLNATQYIHVSKHHMATCKYVRPFLCHLLGGKLSKVMRTGFDLAPSEVKQQAKQVGAF